ncbi:adhesion G protein-coupled receptor E1-like [Ruditapes philippinarum]|uniref:adhesion G protein-coupled receptor E1-like n=1 Tax=Ruditapes philippinarum TaxID=129788 RepID=UPI00295BDF33|nr:adhesion G protein-coupled receptor E1-like [Ruditapes philippinarum]
MKSIFIDIDECRVVKAGADKCEQNCINTDGSFKCSCSSGYKLNGDGRNCSDIDECIQGQSLCLKKNEACVNTPGNYSCICVAGYVRFNESVCEISNGPQFVGNIAFVIVTKPSEEDIKTINSLANRNAMQEQLTERFSYSPNFVSVEVLHLFYINKNRRKRQDSQKGFKIQVDYIVHCQNETNNTLVLKELTDSIQTYQRNITTANKTSFEIGQLKLNTKTSVLKVNTATEGGLCKVEGKTDCAKDSTDCNDYNDGTFNCTCKKGFRPKSECSIQILQRYR